jgi:hypothetical protein
MAAKAIPTRQGDGGLAAPGRDAAWVVACRSIIMLKFFTTKNHYTGKSTIYRQRLFYW